MTTKTLLSLATVSLLAFAAKAYTVETTKSWFSVDASEVDLDESWGTVKPTTKENNLIKVDTEAGSPVTYTPTEDLPTASRYRVTGKMKVTLNAGEPAPFTVAPLPKAALVAASVNEVNKWYAWHLTSESAGEWVAMNGATATLTDGEEYDITIEFTSSGITYYVDGTALTHGDPSTTVLSNAGEMSLSKVGLAGYGSFGDFGALGFESFEVTTTKTEQELVNAGLVVDDGQTIVEALNSEGQNGLLQWQSLALGINPSSTTKPYTAPVQTDNGDLGFTIGNYGTPSVNGNVTFDVYEYDIGEQTLGTKVTKTSVAAGSTAEVTAPTANAGVKYYKIKITFANP